MPITRPPYSPEFRQQIIDLAPAWFARETGASPKRAAFAAVPSGSSGS